MNKLFAQILQQHLHRYPLMETQDCVKLCYQSEYGPEHMITSAESAYASIDEECTSLPASVSPKEIEIIGNGMCRFPLSGLSMEEKILLAELFCRTAQENTGTPSGLKKRLACIEQSVKPGDRAWLSAYRSADGGPIHHSERFRDAYHPHYRVISLEYATFFSVLLSVQQMMQASGHQIIAIDGDCGSGKTSLAQLLRRLYPCRVFHIDDYYLPPSDRPKNWDSMPCGHMDLSRFEQEILLPTSRGETVHYQPYDCHSGQLKAEQVIPPQQLTIVEGSYCLAPSLRRYYDAAFFLTCSSTEQTRRLMEREGAYYSVFKERWIPLEELYASVCTPQLYCNDVINTDLLTASI